MIKFKNSFYIILIFIISFINIQWVAATKPSENKSIISTTANSPVSILNCDEMFYDTGGANSNYSNNENYTVTYCPDSADEIVSVLFTSFEIENIFDILKIYDGNTTSNLIGEYTGTNSPGIVYGTLENGGCLTFEFTSDNSLTKTGWEAIVACESPSTCNTPINFEIANTTEDSVSFSFYELNTPPATTWEIEYGLTGFTQGTGTIYTTTSDYTTITGLSLNTYDAYIRSVCDSANYSDWSQLITFTTDSTQSICGNTFYDTGGASGGYSNNENYTTTFCPDNSYEVVTATFNSFIVETNYDRLIIYDGPSTDYIIIGEYTGTNSPNSITASLTNGGCLTFEFISDNTVIRDGWEALITCSEPASCIPPSSFSTSNITENTVDLNFIENNTPEATSWEIEYGLSGFTQGSGTLFSTSSTNNSISGLIENTTYDAYVRSVCSTDDSSEWSLALTFSTIPFPPTCGELFYDTGGLNGNYQNNEDYSITICPDSSDEIVIATFNMFEVRFNDYLYIHDGDSISSPLLGEFSDLDSPNIISASLANGGCLTFHFISNFVNSRAGWEALINCVIPPTCLTPSEFVLDDVSQTTATFYISEINTPPATTWEIEYGIIGFTQGTGTIFTTTENLTTITGLNLSTPYEAYVRSVCSETDSSYWSVPIPFTTDSEPPVCGGIFYDSGGNGNNYSNNENNTVTICPDNSDDVVTVSFMSFEVENNYDKLLIYDGNDATNLIGEYTGTNSPGTILATLVNGGCLTFVFTSDYSVTRAGWSAQVYCGDPPSCYMPSEIIVDGVTDNSVYLYITEINSPPATTWDIEYGITGFTQGTGTILTATDNFTEVLGLAPGTTYDAYVRSICDVDDESVWTPKVTFTTSGVAATEEFNLKFVSIYPNPARNILTVQLNELSLDTKLKIFNLEGQLLYVENSNSSIKTLNISDLSSGIYFLKIETKNQSFIKKFVKK